MTSVMHSSIHSKDIKKLSA